MARVRQVGARCTVRRHGQAVPAILTKSHTRPAVQRLGTAQDTAACAARSPHCSLVMSAACVPHPSRCTLQAGRSHSMAEEVRSPQHCYAHCNGAGGAASAQRLGYLDAGRRRVGVLCTSAAMLRSHPIRHDRPLAMPRTHDVPIHIIGPIATHSHAADQHSRSRDVREYRAVAGLTWKADLRCRVSTLSAIVPQSRAR